MIYTKKYRTGVVYSLIILVFILYATYPVVNFTWMMATEMKMTLTIVHIKFQNAMYALTIENKSKTRGLHATLDIPVRMHW